MTKRKETKVKKQHRHVATWLESLDARKVRALAHQHGVSGAMRGDVEALRTQLLLLLLLIPEVQQLAGEMKNEIQPE